MNWSSRWWTDHRTVARYKDGRWVPAPMRIERAWAWLFHRGKPVRLPPRIVWILWIGVLVANDVWGSDWGWWLFNHPAVAAGIRVGLMVAAAVAAAGVLFMGAGICIRQHRARTRRSRKES